LLGFNGAEDGSKLTVHGAVYADEGEFTGEIHATYATFEDGTIGGFNISNNKLVSTKNVTVDGTEKPAIELDGENGTIIANQITLGDGARINNQLTLGNAFLFNPTKNGGKLLQVGSNDDTKILLNHDGTASIGSIKINGAESKIYGENWSLTPSLASFSNVSVSGSIKTAVFETETT
jgi:hypothetical protein